MPAHDAQEDLTDLRRHAGDVTRGAGFTFTVLGPGDNDVIGSVYPYPSVPEERDVTVRSSVRTDRSGLDLPLADASHAGSPPTGPGAGWTAAVAAP